MKHLLLLLGVAAVLAPAASAQNMFRGNPAHTGVYDSAGPRSLTNVKWAFKTGGAVVASPTVVDGIAYVGSDDTHLYAIDTATGKEKWRFKTGSIVRSTPAVVDKVAYFGSYDGVFYAVDTVTRKERWRYTLPGEKKFEARGLDGYFPRTQTIPDFWDLYLSSPTVVDGVVYVGCGDGCCYALDAATGALKWKFETKNVVHSSPAVVDGTVFFGSWDTYLYAVDAATGQEKWKFKTGEDPVNFNQTGIQSSPAVVDGVVYFGCRDSNVYAVDAATGQEKWKYRITWVNASPAGVDGQVYFGTSIPAFFVALDAKTGQERFKFDRRRRGVLRLVQRLALRGRPQGRQARRRVPDRRGEEERAGLSPAGRDAELPGGLHLELLRGHVPRERHAVVARGDRLLARRGPWRGLRRQRRRQPVRARIGAARAYSRFKVLGFEFWVNGPVLRGR
jgi:outer membrane protein assembly factor BamB